MFALISTLIIIHSFQALVFANKTTMTSIRILPSKNDTQFSDQCHFELNNFYMSKFHKIIHLLLRIL